MAFSDLGDLALRLHHTVRVSRYTPFPAFQLAASQCPLSRGGGGTAVKLRSYDTTNWDLPA